MRCHEAVTKLPGSYDIVINIQGDEPLMEPHVIDDVVRALQATPEAVYRWGSCVDQPARGSCAWGLRVPATMHAQPDEAPAHCIESTQ